MAEPGSHRRPIGPGTCAVIFAGAVLLNEVLALSEWVLSHWAPFYILLRFALFPLLALAFVAGGLASTVIGALDRKPSSAVSGLCLAVVSGGYLLVLARWPALTLSSAH